MKKELIASTALVGALTFGATVQADEVAVETEIQAVTTQELADQAQASYEQSQEQVATLEGQVAQQEEIVAQAEEAVALAQTDLTTAEDLVQEASQAAEEATPENIVATETAIQEAKDLVAEKTAALETTKAEQDVPAKEKAVKDQEAVVAEKEALVAQKQATLDADKEKLAQAEEAVKENATAISNNQQRQSELTEEIAGAEQSIKDAETALERAKEAEANKKSQLEQANATLKTAQTILSEKESALALAESQLNKAKETTKDAQDAITSLQDKYGIKQTITVTDEYVKLLSEYAKGIDKESYFTNIDFSDYYSQWRVRINGLGYTSLNVPEEYDWENSPELAQYNKDRAEANSKYEADLEKYREQFDKALRDEAVKINEMNAYQVHENSDTTTYDTQALPKEVIADLSNFASYLINTVREQFGTIPTAVTSTSVEFADLVTNRTISDNIRGGHYLKALREVSNQLGFLYSGESWSWFSDQPRVTTLEEMRRSVYKSVVIWLTEGINKNSYDIDSQGWGHARHMAGVNNDTDDTIEYVGYDFGLLGNYFDSFTDSRIRGTVEVDTTIIENRYEVYATLLSEAQTVLATAQSDQATKQTAYDKALGERDTAKTSVTNAEKKVADIEAIETGLSQATTSLTTAKNRHASLVTDLETAKNQLTALQATAETLKATRDARQETVKASQEALTNSQNELTTEQQKLDDLKTILNKAIATVEAAEKELEEAKDKQTAFESYLTKLQTALTELEEAQKLLDDVKAIYITKAQTLQDEKDKLAQLQETLATARQTLEANKARYDGLLTLLAQEKLEAEKQAIIKSGAIPQAIVDETGKIVGYKSIVTGAAGLVATTTPTAKASYSRTARATAEKSLPNTGDSNALLSLVGFGLTTLGLVGRKRRRV